VLGESVPSRFWVVVESPTKPTPTKLVAPVARDGTYTISGVPEGPVSIGVAPFQRTEIAQGTHVSGDGDRDGVVLLRAHRDVIIVAHGADRAPPDGGGMFWLFRDFDPGKAQPTLSELLAQHKPVKAAVYASPAGTLRIPSDLVGKARAADIFVRARDVDVGPLLACGFGLAKDQVTPELFGEGGAKAVSDRPLACVHASADQNVVAIELGPLRAP
jgi:hypothetical protein